MNLWHSSKAKEELKTIHILRQTALKCAKREVISRNECILTSILTLYISLLFICIYTHVFKSFLGPHLDYFISNYICPEIGNITAQ